jgi:hypothetical protein
MLRSDPKLVEESRCLCVTSMACMHAIPFQTETRAQILRKKRRDLGGSGISRRDYTASIAASAWTSPAPVASAPQDV